jgi:hypothetical protein
MAGMSKLVPLFAAPEQISAEEEDETPPHDYDPLLVFP